MPFTIVLVFVLVLSTVLVVVPNFRPEFMQLNKINYQPLLVYIISIAWSAGILIYILQKFILEPFFNKRSLRVNELSN